MRHRGVLLALVAVVGSWSCDKEAPVAPGLSRADKASITQARDSIVAALNRGDINRLYNRFSKDHVTAPPNGPALPVGDKLRGWHQALFDQGSTHIVATPPDLVGAGDVAVDRYDFTLSMQPKTGGKAIEDRGKAVWIWRRQGDGSWKLAYAIWNSDLPAQPAK